MSSNGRLTASELTTVQAGIKLATKTAKRFALLKAEAKKKYGWTIAIAPPGGGYRSFAVQGEMRLASMGNTALAAKWHLNPHSSVPLAKAGGSSHGFGTRMDIVGAPLNGTFFALAAKYGFVREFGSADPNHFMDTGTYKVTVATTVKAATVSKKTYYVVKSGDTLTSIAKHYSTPKKTLTVKHLIALNPGIKPDKIQIKQKVRVA